MIIHNSSHAQLYFGDSGDHFFPEQYLQSSATSNLLKQQPFASIGLQLRLTSFILLKQVHSGYGLVIDDTNTTIAPFSVEGDFLITDQPGVGLGVVTADCLPLILVDHITRVIAIAHVGWRGAVQGISEHVVATMGKRYGVRTEDIQAFLGPSARVCCYEVSSSFVDGLSGDEKAIVVRNGLFFFDLPQFCADGLIRAGVGQIFNRYNQCTICTPHYYSYRRQGPLAGRQVSMVSLKAL